VGEYVCSPLNLVKLIDHPPDRAKHPTADRGDQHTCRHRRRRRARDNTV